jgi:subtilisin-like proprotein convertase family protein
MRAAAVRGVVVVEGLEGRRLMASVSGVVFHDYSGDGVRQGNEPGLGGWRVYADANGNGSYDTAAAQTFGAVGLPAGIPNDAPASTVLAVPVSVSGLTGVVTDIDVRVSATHAYVGDLELALVSPSGVRVLLMNRRGGSGDNLSNTVFDDQATNTITVGSAPFAGRQRPEQSLAAVQGVSGNGTWVVEARDMSASDAGTITLVSLVITTGEAFATSGSDGAYSLAQLAAGTHTVRATAAGGYGSTMVGGGPAAVVIGDAGAAVGGVHLGFVRPGVYGNVFDDANGNGQKEAGESGLAGVRVYEDVNGNGVFDGVRTYVAGGNSVAVPDLGTVTRSVVVSGLGGTISDLDVTVSVLTAYAADVDAWLVSPWGLRIELFTDVGSSGRDFLGTTLDQSAGGAITAGSAPFSGRYRPEGSLNGVNGYSPNGTWSLEVSDDSVGAATTLTGFSVTVTTSADEPSAVTDAAGVYGLALAAGSHAMRVVMPGGYVHTAPAAGVSVVSYGAGGNGFGQAVGGVDFGVRRPPVNISGQLYNDSNTNRVRDAGERPLAGFTVYIDADNDGKLDAGEITATTDAGGGYAFAEQPAGTYVVRAVAPKGWAQTSPGSGAIPLEMVEVVGGGILGGGTLGGGAVSVPVGLSGTVGLTGTAGLAAVGNRAAVSGPVWTGAADRKVAGESIVLSIEAGRSVREFGLDGAVDVETARVLWTEAGGRVVRLSTRGMGAEEAAVRLTGMAGVRYAQAEYAYAGGISGMTTAELTPNDPQYGQQYHHTLMKNDLAWNITLGSPTVPIAIIDNGVELTHPDLAPNLWVNGDEIAGNGIDDDGNGYVDDVNGYDFLDGDASPMPGTVGLSLDHGTHVAGIAAAATNNGVGVAGTAGGARIMALRFSTGSTIVSSLLAQAIVYAVDNGSKILNISYNVDGLVNDAVYRAAISYAYGAGALIVNSAGNSNSLNPARQAIGEVLFVANTRANDAKSSSSSYGWGIDVSAPGEGIRSTTTGGGYVNYNGTSLAAPNAAAAAALIWSANPSLTRDQVAAKLVGGADNIDAANPGFVGLLGNGRVNSLRGITETPGATRIRSSTLPEEGAAVSGFASVTFEFGTVLSPTSVMGGSYTMTGNGADNVFGSVDDVSVPISISAGYFVGSNRLTLTMAGNLAEDTYRFTMSGVADPFGEGLDVNGDGVGDASLVREFRVGAPTQGVTAEGTTVADFGMYAVPLIGSAAEDNWVLKVSGDQLQVYWNVPTTGVPTYSYAMSALDGLSLLDAAGRSTVTLDLSGGVPMPVGGLRYEAAAGSSRVLVVGAGGDARVNLGLAGSALLGLSGAMEGGPMLTATGLDELRLSGLTATVETASLGVGQLVDVVFEGESGQIERPGGGEAGTPAMVVSVDPAQAVTVVAGSTPTAVRFIGGSGTLAAVSGEDVSVSVLQGTVSLGSMMRLTGLSVAPTGVLATGANSLLVDYAGVSPLGGMIAAILEGRLVSDGVVTAGGVDYGAVLGLAEASRLGLEAFAGYAVDETTVVARLTFGGDANLDGRVNALDYERVDLAIGNVAGYLGELDFAGGDVNFDGVVDALDYEQVDLNIGNALDELLGVADTLAGGLFSKERVVLG